ncbi:MAG: hypothetical protein BWY46_00792 [Firmicutes bacterium ADurb.Bin300]|nr:MAG: hypothetical protein BWY46_00792 [Firmicutes bacterium ADurb.Bin300]
MKDTWLKVVVIALAAALVFTIVTSNIVSITAISTLKKAKSGSLVVIDDTTAPANGADDTTASPVDASGMVTQPVDTTPDTASGSGTGGNTATTKASGGSGNTTAPSGKSTGEILNIYKTAINKVKLNAAAGYSKKEWQELPELAIGNNETVNNFVQEKAAEYMTTADEVNPEISAKGSEDAKRRFPGCTLTDLSKIQKATCEDKGSYYKITIVMQDDNTPSKEKNILGQITNSVLYKEEIVEEVDSFKVVKIKSMTILYNDFTITCEITKDGKFRSMKHFATVDIAVSATIFFIPMNGTGKLLNHCEYYDFKY